MIQYSKMTYAEKLLDPRWQKKRLEILARDNWQCQECLSSEKTLHVHHLDYERDTEPWEYPEDFLITLCKNCHGAVKEDRKRSESYIIKSLRLNLKNSFSLNCAEDVHRRYANIDSLYFLLWSLPEDKALEILSSAYIDFVEKSSVSTKAEAP